MQGQADWGAIVWVAGVIAGSAVFGFVLSWRIAAIRTHDKSAIDLEITALEQRVRLIENQNASTLVILEHMKEFRDEITSRIESLRTERNEDMSRIHAMLNAATNLSRFNQIQMDDGNVQRRD